MSKVAHVFNILIFQAFKTFRSTEKHQYVFCESRQLKKMEDLHENVPLKISLGALTPQFYPYVTDLSCCRDVGAICQRNSDASQDALKLVPDSPS